MKEYNTQIFSTSDLRAMKMAIDLLHSGELVAFPTDTVYGLAGDPFNPASLQTIYTVKQRPEEKAIPVLIGNTEQLAQITTDINPKIMALMEAFWPGPLSLVLPKHQDLPLLLTPYPGLAVRMPAHAFALNLLLKTGPLAVTSANLSAHNNALSASDVYAQLGGRIPLILDDGTKPGGQASTVIDCMHDQPKLLREGPVPFQNILSEWNRNE